MDELSAESLVRNPIHARLLRFLFASESGIEEAYLTMKERAALGDLEQRGVVRRDGTGRVLVDRASPQLPRLIDTVLALGDDRPSRDGTLADLDKLRSDYQRTNSQLLFIQQLTSTILKSKSVADLFASGFSKLAEMIAFDIGATVMLEQNIDLYLSKSPDYEHSVNEKLINEVKRTLQSQIPLSLISTDIVIKSDFSDLPRSGIAGGDPLHSQIHTIFKQEGRPLGIFVLFRSGEPFPLEEQRMLEILSAQCSLVLGNIRAQEVILNLAETDELTGIWNRRYFRRMLPGEVERARIYSLPLSILMLDIDDFKKVNDTHGHTTGDVVLSEFCGAVRESLRPPDVLARFGGDEFAVVLPHTDMTGAMAAAERILQKVRQIRIPIPEKDQSISFSASIGGGTYQPPSMTVDELIARTDSALYTAKRSGKNRCSF